MPQPQLPEPLWQQLLLVALLSIRAVDSSLCSDSPAGAELLLAILSLAGAPAEPVPQDRRAGGSRRAGGAPGWTTGATAAALEVTEENRAGLFLPVLNTGTARHVVFP